MAQGVQVSVAPILNVFWGQVSTPLRAKLTFVPAALVEQYAAPSDEKLPALEHSSQAAPLSENFPAGHGRSVAPS